MSRRAGIRSGFDRAISSGGWEGPHDLGYRMDRFAAMNAFVRVVEAGSFTKAADTLNSTKASVTRLVQGLETQLRVRLLHRSTRAVTMTAEGAAYYERAVRLLAELADIESSAAGSSSKPTGRLRVDAGVSIGTMILVPALPDFHAKYPEIHLELSLANRDIDLVKENVDCAIRIGEVAEQDLIARQIGEFAFVACASPSYLRQFGKPAAPEDLKNGHRTVGMISARSGRAIPFGFSREVHAPPHTGPHVLVLDDTNAYVAAGLAGLGIIQAPAFTVQEALNAGTLVQVLEEWRTAVIPVQIVYPPNRYLSSKVRAFIEWTSELFARTPGLGRQAQVSPAASNDGSGRARRQ